MIKKFKSMIASLRTPEDIRQEFYRELHFTNFTRYRVYMLLALLIFLILIVLDLVNRQKGLWSRDGFIELFYVHLITGSLLVPFSASLYIRPPRSPEAVNLRHRATIIIVTMVFAISQILTAFIDQFMKGQITAYVIMAFCIAAAALMRLLESTIFYTACLLAFFAGIGYVTDTPDKFYGHVVNGTILTVVAWVLSRVVYVRFREDFVHKKTIEKQNTDIQIMATRISESEMEYRQLFENSPLGVFRSTADGRVLAANMALLRMLDITSSKDFNHAGLLGIYADPDDRTRLWEKVLSGPVSGFETLFRKSNGRTIPVSISGYMVVNDRGEPQFLEGTIEDITVRKKAEEELRETNAALYASEVRYRLLVENSHDIIYTQTIKGILTFVSPSFTTLLGYPTGQVTGRSFQYFIHPDDVSSCVAYIRDVMNSRQRAAGVEYRVRHADGSWRWHSSNVVILRGESGTIFGFEGIASDITERKTAEAQWHEAVEALRRSKERYRLLAENSDDVIFTIHPRHGFTYISPSSMKLIGIPAEEAMQEKLDSIMTPSSMETVIKEYYRMLPEIERGESPTALLELELFRRGGSTVWAEVSMKTMRDDSGRLNGFIGVARDISERKRSERDLLAMNVKLRASEMEYRHLFEHSPVGIFRTNIAGKVLAANRAALDMLKFGGLDAINEAGLLNLYVAPADRNRLLSLVRQGPVSGFETTLARGDGTSILLSVSAYLEVDEAGNPIYLEGTIEDITERKRAEEELKLRNVLLSSQQEASIDGILVVDENGSMISFNRRFVEMMGIPRDLADTRSEEAALAWVFDKLADPGEFIVKVQHLYANRSEICRDEFSFKDGRTFDRYSSPMLGEDGRYYGRIWYFRDITERKLSEEALRESERRFSDIINFLPLATMVIDREGRITAWNKAMEDLTGLKTQDMLGKGNYEYAIPFYGDRRPILIDRVFSMKDELETRYRNARREGGVLTAESYIPKLGPDGITLVGFASALRNADGSIIGAIESIRDITEMRTIEAELKKAEEKYRTILETMDSGYYEVDLKGNMIFCNPALRKFLGYGETDVRGVNFRDYMDEEEASRILRIFNDVYSGGAPSGDFYWKLNRKGRTSAYSAASVYPVMNAGGQVTGFRGTVRDITAIKEAKDAADEASRSKSVFLANMSHEIRTPMNAILGYAQLMQRDPGLTAQLREHLDIINRSGEHLLLLINDILEMSKIEAGRSVFAPKIFDFHGFLDDLEMMFRVRADSKRLRLLFERIGAVPRWVNTDEGKLRQVLINLLGNAIKFTEEGGVALRIGAQRHMGGDSDLTFELEDTGPGIAEDEVDRLFSAFEQTRTGIRSGGTGLGLALSKGYVQIMGGSLTLSSAVGKGSIFRFTIPVREESELSVPVKKPRRRVLGLAPGHEGTTVLVADDRDTNRWLLSQMLSFAGFTVREVENGEDAIDAFTRWKPRLILMDMAMPVMDGYEATRRIKALPGGDKTVIVAVTASAFEENRQRIMEAGANGYLSKPFKDTELFAIIGELAGVEYIYQDDGRDSVPREKAGDQEQIRTSVASLPAHLIRGLRDATVSANFDRMNELIHEISQINPSAAGAMRDMALRYEYEDLINLLSTGG